MATRHSTDPRARRFERVIRRAIDTRNTTSLRAVACLAHDDGLALVQVRAEAGLRFVGGRYV
jgi:hypothetical protein